ncbi:MAG: EVE domain-containing protein [Anaerolineales bacterium]|nr:EVE domain-containing protein [Anaerolineales bacterium]
MSISYPKMHVQYVDGTTADLNVEIQARIWENIRVEQETAAAKRIARENQSGNKTQFFIKAVTVPSPTEFLFAGWQERVLMATADEAERIQQGDRIIYYVLETQTFVAVATITGPAKEANPKEYFYTVDQESAFFFPVDIDATAAKLTEGVPYDSLELESQPNFRKMKVEAEQFLRITEDDFELLAEVLTEIAEAEEDEELNDEEYIEDDEE